MTRNFKDWLTGYLELTEGTEAPQAFHLFAGVAAIAGALRRKVWFDQVFFRWYPSFYIVLVADPGIATKSTTADLAMDLLRAVPGIKFGPDNCTWQSLVQAFAGSCESFEFGGEWYPMSAITLVASEFGSLMDLKDPDMVNLFITLWDGRPRYEKVTKVSGSDTIEAPWINMLACTTPSWIATNMDKLATSGGLTSRTLYVFAEKKQNYVAYLDEQLDKDIGQLKTALIQDLEHIATALTGPFTLTPEARAWGKEWYVELWTKHYSPDNPDWVKGYIARKQTHLHKLAMILSVSRSDSLELSLNDLQYANTILTATEGDLEKVFAKVGKSELAVAADKFLDYVRRRQMVPYDEAYKEVYAEFPNFKAFEDILTGAIRSRQIELKAVGTVIYISAL